MGFYSDNTTSTTTLEVPVTTVNGLNTAVGVKRFQSAPNTTSARAVSPPVAAAGLEVRMLVSGTPGLCGSAATTSWSATGVQRDSFIFSSVPSCSAGVNFAQLTWSCPNCVFAPGSALATQLHWSCQAIELEVVTVSADGSTRVQREFAAASALSGLIASVSWPLQPLLVVHSDNKVGRERDYVREEFLGYQMIPGSLLVAYVPGGENVQPAAASVSVTFDLSPNSLYLSVVFDDVESVSKLLSSIIGLSGIFGGIGILFKMLEPWIKGWPHKVDGLPDSVRRRLYPARHSEVLAMRSASGTGEAASPHRQQRQPQPQGDSPAAGLKESFTPVVSAGSQGRLSRGGGAGGDDFSQGNPMVVGRGKAVGSSAATGAVAAPPLSPPPLPLSAPAAATR